MPEVLAGVTEVVLVDWMVEEGSLVAVGDLLAELETEKALVEFESEVAGTIARLLVGPGDKVEVGNAIAIVLADGESMDDLGPTLATAEEDADPESGAPVVESPSLDAAVESTEAAADTTVVAAAPAAAAAGSARLVATPIVRKIAREHGADLRAVTGTGPHGRIVRRDLERHLASLGASPAAPAAAAPVAQPVAEVKEQPAAVGVPPSSSATHTDVPLTGMRRAIARRLTESKSTVPHIYLRGECRVDALLALRAQINAVMSERVSVNDLVVKAVGAAFAKVPEANVIWAGDSIRHFEQVDVAIAIALDEGLITPVLRDVGRQSLGEIGRQTRDFVSRAKAGRIKQQEIEGGSFSVTNLGMYGTSEFSAILNPPQSGILAVGAAVERPWVVDGQVSAAQVMTVTLSSDHRVIDGALAARWMAAFVAAVESPLATAIW